MYCEILKPYLILLMDEEEIVGYVDCVSECRGLVKGVLEALESIGAIRRDISGGDWCGELCLTVIEFPLTGVVCVKHVGVEYMR